MFYTFVVQEKILLRYQYKGYTMKKMIITSLLLSAGLLASGSSQMNQNRVMDKEAYRTQMKNKYGAGSNEKRYQYQNQNRNQHQYRYNSGASGQGQQMQMRSRNGSGGGMMQRGGGGKGRK